MSLRYAHCVFPSSDKEYIYLCDKPTAKVGDRVTVSTGQAKIIRFSRPDANAANRKWVLALVEVTPSERKRDIVERLTQIEQLEALAARFKALKSSEAKKLVAEYKRLCK